MPGRNDPCPCGSGLKYKKCCYLREVRHESGDEALAESMREESDSLTIKLLQLAAKTPRSLAEGFFEAGMDNPWLEPEEFEQLLEVEALDKPLQESLAVLLAYRLLFSEGADGFAKTMVRFRHMFHPEEWQTIQACREGIAGFFQIREMDAEASLVHLEDILTEDVYRIRDRKLSLKGELGLIVSGLLFRPSGQEEFGFRPFLSIPLPPMAKPILVERLAGLLQEENASRREQGRDSLEFSRFVKTKPEIIAHAFQLGFFRTVMSIPEVGNTDGDELVFHKAYYRVEALDAARRALEASCVNWDEFEDRLEYRWENEKKYLTHTLTLWPAKSEALMECNSVERFDAWMDDILPQVVGLREVDVDIRFPEEIEDEEPEAETAGEGGRAVQLDPEDAKEIAEQLHQKHLAGWVDEPVPALDGKTPREALKRPELRKRVLDLLDEMDYRAAEAPVTEIMHYLGSHRQRKALGLPV